MTSFSLLTNNQRLFGYKAFSQTRHRRSAIVQAIAQPPTRPNKKTLQRKALQLESLFHRKQSKQLEVQATEDPHVLGGLSLGRGAAGSDEEASSSNNGVLEGSYAHWVKIHLAAKNWLPAPVQSLLDKVPGRVRGLIMLNLLVVMVATNWVVLKDAGTHFDPFMFATLRFGIAALALSPFLLRAKKKTIRAGAELGIYTAIGYLAQSEGLLTTDASRASFLSTFTVLVVPFLAGITGKGVRPVTWAAAVAALVGVSLLEQSGAEPCIGDLWSVISAVAFGVQIFRTEHFSRLLGRRQTIPLMSVVLATTAAIAACSAAATMPETVHHAIAEPAMTLASISHAQIPWKEIMYTGLLTTDVALMMELVALRDVTSTEAAIIYTLEPVLGAGLAFAVLGERWGATGWLGAALIVFSCLGIQIFSSSEESSQPAK